MGNYYSRHAGPKLKAVLDELSLRTDAERHDLKDEIDVALISCDQAFKVWVAVCQDGVADTKTKGGKPVANVEARTKAESYLRACYEHRAKIIETDAKIKSKSGAYLPASNAKFLADQIVRLIINTVGKEAEMPELAQKLLKQIEHLRVDADLNGNKVIVSID